MTKILKMFAALVALASMPAAKRGDGHEAKLAEKLKEAEAALEAFEANGDTAAEKIAELKSQTDQLRKELDAAAEETRRITAAGLGVVGGRIIVPGGKTARLEMLKDNRAFLDDADAKRFGAFMAYKALKTWNKLDECPKYVKDIAEDVIKRQKDLDPNVDASGGYIIADEFRPELIRNVEATGVFFPQMRRLPLVGLGTMNIPKRTAGLTAYWTAAGAQGTRSTPTLDLIQLTPEKLMALVAMPNEFLRSSLLVDLGNWLGTELVYALQYALDNAAINGDGSADYGGITGIMQSANITSVAAASGNVSLATLDAVDLSNAIAGITVDYAMREPKWGMSLSVLMSLRGKRNSDEMPIFERANGEMPANIDGYPFDFGNTMVAAGSVTTATKYAFFGDLRQSHICGMLRDINIAASEHVLFESDMHMLRAVMHVDIVEAETNAIITAKTAAS